jgi:transcriptional regulator with XRE-family HTH domain
MAKDELKDAWLEYDAKLTKLVQKVMKTKNITGVELAKKVKMSQSAISEILTGTKHWTMATTLQLAKVFDTTFSQLMYEVENPTSHPMFLIVGKTKPNSIERLQALVYAAVGYTDMVQDGWIDDVVKLFFQVNMIERDAPTFCYDYQAGKLPDRQALAILEEANDTMLKEQYKGKMTFGLALQYVYTKELNLIE